MDTIEAFAKMLSGREYGNEITKQEEQQAKELGFIIVFGASDDLMEFRGAIDDEIDCYNGGRAYLTKTEVTDESIENSKIIEAIWDKDEYSWIYETDIPHETFDIYEDGEKYCKGMIIDINDLSSNKCEY